MHKSESSLCDVNDRNFPKTYGRRYIYIYDSAAVDFELAESTIKYGNTVGPLGHI